MKNLIIYIFTFILIIQNGNSQSIAINNNGAVANSSSVLDVSSTSKGVLIPRMTMAQRNAITSPSSGLLIYQTDNTPGFYYYNGSSWMAISSDNDWVINGNNISHESGGRVIIGEYLPAPWLGGGDTTLHVYSNGQRHLAIFENTYDCGGCAGNTAVTAIIAKSIKGDAIYAETQSFGSAIHAKGGVFVETGNLTVQSGDVNTDNFVNVGKRLNLSSDNGAGSSAGSIRWDGSDFLGYDGTAWRSLTNSSNALWSSIGGSLYRSTGSIGIGAAPNTSYVLDVRGDALIVPQSTNEGFVISNIGTEPSFLPTTDNYGYIGNSNQRVYRGFFNQLTVNTFTNLSDRRIKENITPLKGALNKILQLNGKSYDFKKSYIFGDKKYGESKTKELEDSRKNKIGFIAQELEEVLPQLVRYDEASDLKSVDYIGVIPLLVEAIKEQNATIQNLQKQIDELKDK